MAELEDERARLKTTLARYGETLAATHDLRALLRTVLETAVAATRARGGRLLLYDPERGEASEQVRLGTARGSRADLPMVVVGRPRPRGRGAAGAGTAHVIVAARDRGGADPARGDAAGLVTVVDPEDGAFGEDDVETLAGLAAQAGVAIENARLHRVVEQQAITDELTSLANRRQFYEVLGRESSVRTGSARRCR